MLQGRLWFERPAEVVADDGDLLATLVRPGMPFTVHDHLFGTHPWAHLAAWGGTTVLMLHKTGERYSVWKFFEGDRFTHWYVNFEAPYVRVEGGVEVDDHELDLLIDPDGVRTWKDVEHLHPSLESGRIDLDQLRLALAAAAEVSDLLDRDERWWAPWDGWVPA